MNWLIQSLLKLAKLDVGAIEFHREPRSLQQTVLESVEMIHGLAEQRGVALVADFDSHEASMIKHDKEWLIEALLNVLKNGIEHTPAGGIVRVELETGTTLCRIHIQDQGEGIERSEIPHIFNRFYKGKKNKKSGSVGIGLSLSKSIVEGHGGVIDVQSQRGEGTRFTFLIPK
jgi:signal transduction histidine kinase